MSSVIDVVLFAIARHTSQSLTLGRLAQLAIRHQVIAIKRNNGKQLWKCITAVCPRFCDHNDQIPAQSRAYRKECQRE
jgi:hypothetical protein